MKTVKLIGMALAALLALPMGAATADVWATLRFTGDDDVMRKVRIDNAPRNLFLQTKWHNGFYEGDVFYWLDTRRRDPGPEFRVRVYLDEFNSNGSAIPSITLRRVDGFKGRIGERDCAGLSGRLSDAGNVNVTVPRRCLRVRGQLPGAVRLSVGVFFAYGGPDFDGSWAWSPARHRFGPWVTHS
jgi:hypothetical protein